MKITRPLTRETPDRDPVWNEVLMIRLVPEAKYLEVWQKGRRRRFQVAYSTIWRLGVMAVARAKAAEKKAKKRNGHRPR